MRHPRRRLSRTLVAAGLAAAALLGSRLARAAGAADRVAVLPFMANGGGTTTAELEAARAATRDAVTQLHDVLPSDAELAAGLREVKDGVADTSAEYRAAGRAAAAHWTLAGHVDAHGSSYRLELEACQVGTGRVESLAREVDGRQAAPQIAEMLALLLRQQGVGDTVPPWDQPAAAATKPAPAPPPSLPPALPPAPEPPTNVPPPAPAEPPRLYAENHPYALGLGGEVTGAFNRASNARGSATAGTLTVTGAYAFEGARGLEAIADLGIAVAGPSSLRVDGGLRYELAIVPSAHLFLGPEIAVGAFFALGGDKDPRFLMRGALPLVLGIGERVQIEAYPDVVYAIGGTTSLGFLGGGIRGMLRF